MLSLANTVVRAHCIGVVTTLPGGPGLNSVLSARRAVDKRDPGPHRLHSQAENSMEARKSQPQLGTGHDISDKSSDTTAIMHPICVVIL